MKVLSNMYSENSRATYNKPIHKRTLLDAHHWDRYDLNLFYEGKKLCLELTEGDEHRQIGHWTFCADARHLERVQITSGFSIDVAYRPAHIAVSFCESCKGNFLKRWIRSSDRVHWSEYQLRPDGMVSVTRPNEELVVG